MTGLGQNAKYPVRADLFRFALELGHCAKQRALRIWVDSAEKVENTAKTKFSQKLAGGRFLLRMRSSYEEEGRRKLLLKSTWPTVSDGVKPISGS
jgi:hypothetical protein